MLYLSAVYVRLYCTDTTIRFELTDMSPRLHRRLKRPHTVTMATATKRRKATNVPCYELRQFTWVREHMTLVCEASDLGRDNLVPTFNIKSPTGRVYQFTMQNALTDKEQEIMAWWYTPVDPECPVVRVTIYND